MSDWMNFFAKEGFKLASELPELKASAVPLPSPSCNWAVGNGGIVEGKWVLLFGPESGGKSLIAQIVMAEIQKKYPDGICVLFDTEFSLSKEWFAKLGGDPDRLVIKQTNNPTQIFDWTDTTLREKIEAGMPVKCICIDSIRAIRFPKDEKPTTDNIMGGSGAGYLTRAFKTIVPTVKPHNITVVLTQHVYEEMDQWKKMRNPYIVPDGRNLRHYSDYMIQIERLQNKDSFVKNGDIITGHKVRLSCKKNKVAAPYREAEFVLDYNKGIINTESEIFELGRSTGAICHPVDENGKEKTRSWIIKTKPDNIFTGEDAIKEYIMNTPEAQDEVMLACGMVSAGDEIIEE